MPFAVVAGVPSVVGALASLKALATSVEGHFFSKAMTKKKIVIECDLSKDLKNAFPAPVLNGSITELGALIATHMCKSPKFAAVVTIAANMYCLDVGANPGDLVKVFLGAKKVADDREAKQN